MDGIKQNVLGDAATVFQLKNMAILSNSVGSSDDKNYKEAIEVEKTLGLKVIKHVYKKPNVLNEIKDHFQIVDVDVDVDVGDGEDELLYGCTLEKTSQIAIIGDRILSDIVMGN